jgi:hypothetical protein
MTAVDIGIDIDSDTAHGDEGAWTAAQVLNRE